MLRTKTTSAPGEVDRGPLLGGLLRLCHQQVLAHLEHGFAAAGLVPLQPTVTQPLWDHPEGLRLTELALRARITKQSMAELVTMMEVAGYVERVADATDGRARLVRLTRKGRKVGRLARDLVGEVEARWAATLGARRVEALRATLRAIAERP